jgi:hypothetical protein
MAMKNFQCNLNSWKTQIPCRLVQAREIFVESHFVEAYSGHMFCALSTRNKRRLRVNALFILNWNIFISSLRAWLHNLKWFAFTQSNFIFLTRKLLLPNVWYSRWCIYWVFRRARKIEKTTISFVMPFRPSVRIKRLTRLPLDGLSWNKIFEYFSKISRENSRLIKTW